MCNYKCIHSLAKYTFCSFLALIIELAFVQPASAQNSERRYYFIWNNQEFKGRYTDTTLCDGVFEQHMILKCKRDPFVAKPHWVEDESDFTIESGSFAACKPTDIWTRLHTLHSFNCDDCHIGLGWEQTDYSNPDTITRWNFNTTKFFDPQGNLHSGVWGWNYGTFSCNKDHCTIYSKNLAPLLSTPLHLLEMKIDSLIFIGAHRD